MLNPPPKRRAVQPLPQWARQQLWVPIGVSVMPARSAAPPPPVPINLRKPPVPQEGGTLICQPAVGRGTEGRLAGEVHF